jgi:crotonobetainyl-CoA:carnitine CoA-transferase CaiB-like acyl-CoA transferase
VTTGSLEAHAGESHDTGQALSIEEPVSQATDSVACQAALAGLNVVECARGIAGPYAAMLLAEQGAEVLKIEPPSGDPARALPGFYVWNRSKHARIVDLATHSGRRGVFRLSTGSS